jgi:glyoxylase-like metal-dependent hydrolase (beta-lactamase superfamily II)
VDAFVTGPFQENTYLVSDESAKKVALVDPGDEAPRLLKEIEKTGLTLDAIWLTHAHVDHVGAVAGIRRATGVPIYLHPADLPLYRNATRQGALYGLAIEQPPDPDVELAEGMSLSLGTQRWSVMHTPGHCPGHVVIYTDDVAFVGDCLFAGSIGRTDLPLSDPKLLMHSLGRITALPQRTRVLPGHGPATTIGEELDSNPFLVGLNR